MSLRPWQYWPVAFLAVVLVGVIGYTLKPYQYNITALFHMDHTLGDAIDLPKGFVVLGVPSYDGAQYYQVARTIPRIANPARWKEIHYPPGSYAYQRFLLPLTAFIVSFGQEGALPYAFVLINFFALLATCVLVLRWRPRKTAPLYALALCLSPAAMVATHFTLAEPLTILIITLLLIRYDNTNVLKRPLDLTLLSLLVLAREVNILFVLFLIGFFLLQKKWIHAVSMLVPAAVFIAWHTILYAIFGDIPFLISTGAHQIPGKAAFDLVIGKRGYNQYTLSAIALCLGLVLPALLWTAHDLLERRRLAMLPLGALAFLCLMTVMPDYIWGSITSIGRVITPVYPLLMLYCADRDTLAARYFALATLGLGLAAAAGLASIVHPFTVL